MGALKKLGNLLRRKLTTFLHSLEIPSKAYGTLDLLWPRRLQDAQREIVKSAAPFHLSIAYQASQSNPMGKNCLKRCQKGVHAYNTPEEALPQKKFWQGLDRYGRSLFAANRNCPDRATSWDRRD